MNYRSNIMVVLISIFVTAYMAYGESDVANQNNRLDITINCNNPLSPFAKGE